MRNLFITGLLFLIIVSTAEAQKTIELFNYKNLMGWYAFEPETGKHPQANELFTVDKQTIRMYGPKAGYLMSEQSFRDFRMEVEYRWNTDSTFVRKSNKKNSGVMYLVPAEQADTLWPKGVQFQIKEGATGDFILLNTLTLTVNGVENTPGRSVVIPRTADSEKPFGEWNVLVITVENGKVTQELNGVKVNEGTNPSVTEGRILLQ